MMTFLLAESPPPEARGANDGGAGSRTSPRRHASHRRITSSAVPRPSALNGPGPASPPLSVHRVPT
jgi:hypothetical protein